MKQNVKTPTDVEIEAGRELSKISSDYRFWIEVFEQLPLRHVIAINLWLHSGAGIDETKAYQVRACAHAMMKLHQDSVKRRKAMEAIQELLAG